MSHPEIFSKKEQDKLAKLEKLIKPDSLPEELFHKISLLAQELFTVPQVLIRVVSKDKHWFNSTARSAIDYEGDVDSWLKKACLQSKISFDIPDFFQVSNVNQSSTNDDNLITKFYIATPIYFADGKIIGALCLIDTKPINLSKYQKSVLKSIANLASEALTLKSSANQLIHAKQAKLAAIVESSDDAIISKTLDGVVVSWNQGAEKLFGYSADEMIGKSITVLFPKDRIKEEAYFIKRIKNNLPIKHYETERLNKDGNIISISVSISPIRNEYGDVIGISKIARDVSAQNKLQQALLSEQLKSEKLAAIVESSDDAIISKTLDGVVVSWNQGAEKLFGYSADEMIGKSITVLFPKDKLKEEVYFLNQLKNNLHIKHYETERFKKNGDTISVSVSLSPIKGEYGEIIGISKIARDISTKKNLQQKIATEHARLKVTMDSIGDAVITTDENAMILYLNPVAEKLTGWLIGEAIGMPLYRVFNIVNEKSHMPVENPVEVCIKENRTVGLAHHALLINQNGSQYGIEDSAAPIHDISGKTIGAVLVFHDVTTQRKMANEMTYRATHDSLTGLLNRVEFEYILAELLRNVREPTLEHALIYIDLDQFKIINDTCGHSAGDEVLKDVAKVMGSCIRNTDILARIGGDEFAIILERCDTESAIRIAELLCKSIDEYRFQHIKRRFHIGASIGLVLIDRPWPSVTSLIQAADSACYAAKEGGRNRVQMHFETDGAFVTRREEMHWVSYIDQALEDNNFLLYCQRILPLNNQNTIHGEVLLRMKDDSGGLISPGEFLPAAEHFHMITRIDRWVVSEVFTWLKIHEKKLSHIENLSINLSGQSISDRDFHIFVIDLIKKINPDCNKICFEITETAAITNITEATRFIELMKQLGIKFSLDDFGSGVSSFGYLKSLSVEYLKIDGQFIRGIIEDSIDQATVRCILEIAKVTGKQTIAECVETESAENMLKEMGVDFIQGYLRHKPAPINEILKI
jgi:diguanylate cyclase